MKTMITTLLLCTALGLLTPAMAQAPREDAIWARTALRSHHPGRRARRGGLGPGRVHDHRVRRSTPAFPAAAGRSRAAGNPSTRPTPPSSSWSTGTSSTWRPSFTTSPSAAASSSTASTACSWASRTMPSRAFPSPPTEYLYSWWYAETGRTAAGGHAARLHRRLGRTAPRLAAHPRADRRLGRGHRGRRPDQRRSTARRRGYTVEMRFNLTPMGYDVTQPDGDIVEWNISVYDMRLVLAHQRLAASAPTACGGRAPGATPRWYSEVRIHARPDVTTAPGPVPAIGPELVDSGHRRGRPTIDGELTEAVWSSPEVYSFDIRWDDDALRETYDGVGPYRSGQFQPHGQRRRGLRPRSRRRHGEGLHRGDMLYMGFDVARRGRPVPSRLRSLGRVPRHRSRTAPNCGTGQQPAGPAPVLPGRRPTARALPQDYLLTLVTAGSAEVAIHLHGRHDGRHPGPQADNGYTAELAIDLTAPGLSRRISATARSSSA